MPPLFREEETYAMDSRSDPEDEHISTEILEGIRYGSQSHTRVNRRYACYKRRDCIKLSQAEWKEALLSTKTWENICRKSLRMLLFRF